VRALLRICGERLLAVCRLDQLVSGVAQQVPQDLPVVFLIFNHQDALAHASTTCRSTFTGIVNANVEPLPTSDSTQMRPPCISMMRLAIASPSPVPPFCLVIDASACWNSSKILFWSFSAMPGPVSCTATVKVLSEVEALIDTSPVSVNLIALPTRLSRTWVRRRSSPCAGGRSFGSSTFSARFLEVASDSTAPYT